MSTPTTISIVRAGLIAAIKTVLGPDVPVFESRVRAAWYLMNLPGHEAIVMCYEGQPMKERGPVGSRDRQGYVYRFSIAICSGDWATPVGATYGAADLGERLRGSPALPRETPNLRTQQIATILGEDVYVRFLDEVPTAAPNSTMQGGRFALLQTWETSPEVRA